MTDVAPPNPAEDNEPAVSVKTRAALTLLALLAMFGVAVSQPSGPVLRGTVAANGTAGNLTYTYAQPSPGVSPVSAGKLDVLTTDGTGALWVKSIASTITNLLTTDLDSNGSTNVTTGAGVALLVPGAGGPATVGGSANGLRVVPTSPDGTQITYANGVSTIITEGQAAHDAVWSNNPVGIAGYAYASGGLPSTVSANGDVARLLLDRYGRPRVALESATGGALTDSGGLYVQANDTAQAVGHDTVFEAQCAGGTAESTAKASAGILKWIHVSNPNTSDVFLQVFNASNPTPGSTSPTMIFCVPGGSGASNRGVYNQEFGPVGVTFSTAITYTITTTATGGTAPAANCTTGFGYK